MITKKTLSNKLDIIENKINDISDNKIKELEKYKKLYLEQQSYIDSLKNTFKVVSKPGMNDFGYTLNILLSGKIIVEIDPKINNKELLALNMLGLIPIEVQYDIAQKIREIKEYDK